MKKQLQPTPFLLYKSENGNIKVDVLVQNETVWLTQEQMGELFGRDRTVITKHISNIFKEGELEEQSNVQILHFAHSDKPIKYYNLDVIISVGYRVKSLQGTRFRQWATSHLKEFIIKGFVMDDERLKNPDGKPDYFDELLARIRDIRASEKRFYQKVRDLFSLSSDYDTTDKATQLFYAGTQNKLLFAITGKTAAEIIVSRASASEPNMALTSFQGPIVRKQDIYTAKNYLTEDEIDSLNRFVVVFLETAELRAKNRQDVTMDFWRENIDRIIEFNDKEVLKGYGSIGHEQMKKMVEKVYETFETKRKAIEAIEADKQDLIELKQIEEKVKAR